MSIADRVEEEESVRRVNSASMQGVKVEAGEGGRSGWRGVLVGEKEGGREAVIRARAEVREADGMSSISMVC